VGNENYVMDHVAIPSHNIARAVEWYVGKFAAVVLYQDETWAFLKLGQGKLALVTPGQHPPHVALRVDHKSLISAAGEARKPIDQHRDGTTGIYVTDPDGNELELICYPDGQTTYPDVAS
jgi:catechol 2,3-dioxygenase-like lactoylglutathione lyase family enzyme